MLGAYPRASRSRGSPASRAMPWVVATAASISSISASSVARGFADSPGMPAKRLRVGQLGDEALRAAREPRPVELADPVVHCEVAVELRVLQAEAGRGVVVHGGVPEGAVELLVAHLRKQRGDPDVRDLHVLEMA